LRISGIPTFFVISEARWRQILKEKLELVSGVETITKNNNIQKILFLIKLEIASDSDKLKPVLKFLNPRRWSRAVDK
jgi:hypothetical protein